MNEEQINQIINSINKTQEYWDSILKSVEEFKIEKEENKKLEEDNFEVNQKILDELQIINLNQTESFTGLKEEIRSLSFDGKISTSDDILYFNMTVVFLLGFIGAVLCVKSFIGGFQGE